MPPTSTSGRFRISTTAFERACRRSGLAAAPRLDRGLGLGLRRPLRADQRGRRGGPSSGCSRRRRGPRKHRPQAGQRPSSGGAPAGRQALGQPDEQCSEPPPRVEDAEDIFAVDCPMVSGRGSTGVRMGREIRFPASAIGNVRIELGRGEVGVAEHLLDAAQVGPALEQVRGERVAEKMRVDAPGSARRGPRAGGRSGTRRRA